MLYPTPPSRPAPASSARVWRDCARPMSWSSAATPVCRPSTAHAQGFPTPHGELELGYPALERRHLRKGYAKAAYDPTQTSDHARRPYLLRERACLADAHLN